MKKLSLLVAVIIIFTTASVAKTSDLKNTLTIEKRGDLKNVTPAVNKINVKHDFSRNYVCTVSATWTNARGSTTTMTMKVDCADCTSQAEACDDAYNLVKMFIPKK